MNPEENRLLDHHSQAANWKKWGPYLSERSWGTVREDYTTAPQQNTWTAFPFDEAHKRVFRWGEDGLGGICDRLQCICFAFAFWNGKDPLLKERLFGLSSIEGNHGEDVKELYYYLDATPTSSYLKMLYYYPQREFPYKLLREENRKRGLQDPEYELIDTGIFADDRFFEILIEYAKENEEDILCRLTVKNRGKEVAPLTLLPTIWFRNTWAWGETKEAKPALSEEQGHILLSHPLMGNTYLSLEKPEDLLFCDNEEKGPYPKDSLHHFVVSQEKNRVNPQKKGTKAAGLYSLQFKPGEEKQIHFRLSNKPQTNPFANASNLFAKRKEEADLFYAAIQPPSLSDPLKNIQRKAFAGLLFSKQFYYLDQLQWQKEGAHHSEPRNEDWDHLTTLDLLSVPDKWEFPYFCCWDTAFHCIPMVLIDSDFAKRQLTLLTREWYMHPSGQLPAYEWSFSDVNPPVHAWAVWRVYKIDAKKRGSFDRGFLEGLFHKLLLNFTWWINKKDADGHNVFQGGFLGMDNISIFDRSKTLPTGGHLDQSDGSAWMSFYCIMMLKISLHLSEEEPVYQDMATKFFEHFLRIARAMTHCGGNHHSLWNEEDGFFYDLIHLPSGEIIPLKVRSLVGLLPLLAVETLEGDMLENVPIFKRRMEWFIEKRPDTSVNVECMHKPGTKGRRLLSIVKKEQLIHVLRYMLDEDEFLSPYGIRSLSKYHKEHPYVLHVNGNTYEVNYVPGDSDNKMFGGNSNWRGPVWFPINFLLIEALQKYHHYYGDELKVEFPTRSGHFLSLGDVATELSKRLIQIFLPGQEHPLFYEFFHGDTGKGLGASHHTGWTALVAKLIQQSGELL